MKGNSSLKPNIYLFVWGEVVVFTISKGAVNNKNTGIYWVMVWLLDGTRMYPSR